MKRAARSELSITKGEWSVLPSPWASCLVSHSPACWSQPQPSHAQSPRAPPCMTFMQCHVSAGRSMAMPKAVSSPLRVSLTGLSGCIARWVTIFMLDCSRWTINNSPHNVVYTVESGICRKAAAFTTDRNHMLCLYLLSRKVSAPQHARLCVECMPNLESQEFLLSRI